MARTKRASYNLNRYPEGMGKIKCEICGIPVRDHKVGPPCPFAPDRSVSERVTADRRGRTK